MSRMGVLLAAVVFGLAVSAGAQDRLQSSDLLKLRSVSTVQLSPDATRLAYTIENNDGTGRPYTQVWVLTLADGKAVRFGSDKEPSGDPQWSPDGRWIAYRGRTAGKTGLVVAHPDGSETRFVAEMTGTNAPLPGSGRTVAWSPDSRQLAFVSSTPGPETAEANGDPMVITRYLYKPDAAEGLTHFNDNRRLHLFVVDLASLRVEQLTSGNFYEHSIDWSPNGQELLFLTNRDADDDEFFNYDVYALRPADKSIRRLSVTESNEYRPRWSPDGRMIVFQATTRGLTDRETTMEDTHVWVMNGDGTNRRDLGAAIDNRQGVPEWTADGSAVMFTVQERGNVRLYRVPITCGASRPPSSSVSSPLDPRRTNGGALREDGRRTAAASADAGQACPPERVVTDQGSVGSFSASKNTIAYAFTSATDQAQLYVIDGSAAPRKLTDLNSAILGSKRLGEVESFTFVSNDNKFDVEAFLTKPGGLSPAGKYPLIVNIHGGPHGQQGAAFNFKNQVYAARGWATLMVNYRGSTGYGQAFADAVFADQNGNEGQDVLYGVSAAIRRYPWIDRDRMGVEGTSYGGQLSAWLITQTNIFKASIPTAAITNIVSYNYMTYYNQYEAMEWGVYPHQGNLMDTLLQRSALRHVANAHTPTMLMHGENDNDVPIAETEQFYIALRDVGTEAVMVRYPREGHGIRESKHVVDSIDRSIKWYEKHFKEFKS
jgi:dipeptidyl aminopeptidase/acylaminoacyl peptidase